METIEKKIVLAFRVTSEEKKRIKKEAYANLQNISEYIRTKINE